MPKSQRKYYNVTARNFRVIILLKMNKKLRIHICVSVAIAIEHLMLKHHIILKLLACFPLSAILFQISHQAHNFRKYVIKYNICVWNSQKCVGKFKFQKRH